MDGAQIFALLAALAVIGTAYGIRRRKVSHKYNNEHDDYPWLR